MDWILNAFVVLFVVVDPVGNAPIFAGLTRGLSEAERRRAAFKGVMLAAAILLVFFAVGNGLLSALGIGIPAFRIAGGILLFLTALEMLFERRSRRRRRNAEDEEDRPDPSVFPLAIPLIAGPGAIASMILLAGQAPEEARALHLLGVHLVMALVLALVLALFLAAGLIERALGATGILVVTRLLGMLLAALSVQFVLDGLAGAGFMPG